MPTKQGLFDALSNLSSEIQGEKQAAHNKQSSDPPDPGGYQGPSSHPTTQADNSGNPASEGSRSSENAADVKADQGQPGVDNTSEATPNQDEQDGKQLNIGTNQSATGEDPSVENDYKGTKDDEGRDAATSHPTKADKDREKYSGHFKTARDNALNLANDVLADLAAGYGDNLQKAAADGGYSGDSMPMPKGEGNGKKDKKDEKYEYSGDSMPMPKGEGNGKKDKKDEKYEKYKPAEKESGDQASTPFQQNLDAARQALHQSKEASEQATSGDWLQGYELAQHLGIDKQAAYHNVKQSLARTLVDARTQADLVGGYLHQKQAMLEQALAEEEGAAEGEGHEGGGEAPPEDPLAMLAGAPPEEEPPPEEGMMLGAPPEEELPPEEGGAPVSEEEAMQELIGGLEELGKTAADLQSLGTSDGQEMADAVATFRSSGQYQIKEASTKRARQLRDKMKIHLKELFR